MTRLVLHCGLQKTGTTSFHHFVQKNAGALPDGLRILTPEKGTVARTVGRRAVLWTSAPDDKTRAEFIAAIVDLRQAIEAAVEAGAETVLVSHENLPGAMPGYWGETGLYPHLEEVIDLLDTHLAPFVPEYVVYVREMASWKRSVHNQAVKSDGYTGDWDQFLTETAAYPDWAGLRARLERALGDRQRVFRLEDEADASRPGAQLLQHVGCPEDALGAMTFKPARLNQSLNAGALEFMRQINAQHLDRVARRKVAQLVRDNQALFKTVDP